MFPLYLAGWSAKSGSSCSVTKILSGQTGVPTCILHCCTHISHIRVNQNTTILWQKHSRKFFYALREENKTNHFIKPIPGSGYVQIGSLLWPCRNCTTNTSEVKEVPLFQFMAMLGNKILSFQIIWRAITKATWVYLHEDSCCCGFNSLCLDNIIHAVTEVDWQRTGLYVAHVHAHTLKCRTPGLMSRSLQQQAHISI